MRGFARARRARESSKAALRGRIRPKLSGRHFVRSIATKTHLVQQGFHLERHCAHVRPTDARTRIEIDPQLVRMIEIAGAHRMRMQLDATEIDDPRKPRRVLQFK